MSFPNNIDSPGIAISGTTALADPTYLHAQQHNLLGNSIIAVETVLGTTGGNAVLSNFAFGDKAARQNHETLGTATLQAPVIQAPTINGQGTNSGTIAGGVYGTAQVTGGTSTSQVINTPTGDVVTLTGTQALTNKTSITTNQLITPFLNSPTTLANSLNSNLVIPTTSSFVSFIGGGASCTIGGIVAGVEGQRVVLYNATGDGISFLGENTSSTATNRIFTTGLATRLLNNLGAIELIYSVTIGRWVMISV